jgi:hypothetical protein
LAARVNSPAVAVAAAALLSMASAVPAQVARAVTVS